MNTFKKRIALLLALFLLLGTALHAVSAVEEFPDEDIPEDMMVEPTEEEAEPETPEEPEMPAEDEPETPADADSALPTVSTPVEEAPKPYATMPPVKKEDMPKPNADAKAEAIVIKSEGISLFELPAHESGVLTQLDAGSVVTLLILGQTWSKVKTPANEGYVPTKDLRFAFGDVQTGIGIVTASGGKLTLRQQMTTKSKALGTVKSGRAVLILAKGETFSLVRYEGKEGYVLTAHIKEVEPSTNLGLYTQVVSLTKDREANVRLRAEPKRNAKEYTKVKSGNSLIVLDIKDDWAQVEYEGYHGYMMAEYLKRFD
ncbi:MAG: SH3 domain-containing protein [Clostridiales bacterium]|nr:SH3 domain-containing protein [Clostridiales bacterium]